VKKESYHPYSAAVITLKAGILPPIISLIGKSVVDDNLTVLLQATSVFFIEVVFIFLAKQVNTWELNRARRTLKQDIATLKGELPNCTNPEVRRAMEKLLTTKEMEYLKLFARKD
jgi:hypothetical protein